jgi:hypothetical protein
MSLLKMPTGFTIIRSFIPNNYYDTCSIMVSITDIQIYIFSWKKVTDNAKQLYRAVATHFPNVYFINCDEHTLITDTDISNQTIQLDDRYYYGGQFETAIHHSSPGKYIGIIVGDVSPIADWEKIAAGSVATFNTGQVGIYAPNVDYTWHTKRATNLWGDLWTVPNTDCTCWFIHPTIINKIRDIPFFNLSNLGWGIDELCINESLYSRLFVARDYSVLVRQPKGTAYDTTRARQQWAVLMEYYRSRR